MNFSSNIFHENIFCIYKIWSIAVGKFRKLMLHYTLSVKDNVIRSKIRYFKKPFKI